MTAALVGRTLGRRRLVVRSGEWNAGPGGAFREGDLLGRLTRFAGLFSVRGPRTVEAICTGMLRAVVSDWAAGGRGGAVELIVRHTEESTE